MNKGLWGLIWSSFQDVQNFLFGFLGIALAILFSVLTGKASVPLYILIILLTIFLFVSFSLFRALEKIHQEYQRLKHPQILRVRQDQTTGEIHCLFEKSELFATDLRVSFYYIDDNGFESRIAVGYIKTIQSDGKIQVSIDYPESTYSDILEKLKNNDERVITKILIKPGIPRDFIQP
ncbi:MAG: hypothetical protein ACK5CA_06335 [Cyanobacteriota bacterium]|jgi:hypothetical protein